MRHYILRPSHVSIRAREREYWMPGDRASRLHQQGYLHIHPNATEQAPVYLIPDEHVDRLAVFLELTGPTVTKYPSRKQLNKAHE